MKWKKLKAKKGKKIKKRYLVVAQISISTDELNRIRQEFEKFLNSNKKTFSFDGTRVDIREIWD